jgi:hypothetical protein
MTENERFGLVFVNTGSINSGPGCCANPDQDFFRAGIGFIDSDSGTGDPIESGCRSEVLFI